MLRHLEPGEALPTASNAPCLDDPATRCVIEPLPWRSAPPPEELAGLYGVVTVVCRIKPDGGLEGCRGREETPGAHVLGAQFIAERYLAPTELDGRSTAGAVVAFIMTPPGPPR